MHLGIEHCVATYFINNNGELTEINNVTEQRYFGVLIDDKLKCVPHIQPTVKKTNSNLVFIKPSFCFMDKAMFLTLTMSSVGHNRNTPLQCGHSFTRNTVYPLEVFKSLMFFQGINYTDRVKELMPPSLQCRISRADRVEVLKIIKDMAKCEKIKLFTIQRASRTRGYNQKIFKKADLY